MTIDGDKVSLTGAHNIPIFDPDQNQTRILRSSKVTMKDHLIRLGQTVPLKEIRKQIKSGFYSPLTLSGYLLVNGISTNVYSDR